MDIGLRRLVVCLGLTLTLLIPTTAFGSPLFLLCDVEGKSFDQNFRETVGVKVEGETIDVLSDEFPLFGKVQVTDRAYLASKRFTSRQGVRYFFSIEIDRVSGRFSAYETSAFPDRRIYHTTGVGPCKVTNESRFLAAKTAPQRQPVRVTISPAMD